MQSDSRFDLSYLHHVSHRRTGILIGIRERLMYYAVKHETTFRYSDPISESVMEVYMQPRTEGIQRCLRFNLLTYPRARAFEHYDYLGNIVHSFDIPTQHEQLK